MLVIMKNDATEAQIANVMKEITNAGYRGIPIPGDHRTAVCIVGNQGMVEENPFLALEGVKEVLRVTKPYKLVSRETCPEPTVIRLGDVEIGNGCKPVIIAGPCSVEAKNKPSA